MHKMYMNKQGVWFLFLVPIVSGVTISLMTLLISGPSFVIPVIFAGATLWFFVGLYFLLGKCMMRIYISEHGIGNKHIFLSWEEIDEIGRYYVYRLDYSRWPQMTGERALDSVIGIGNTEERHFFFESAKEKVFFAINKEIFAALEECGRGKSKIIDEILERFAV